MPFPSLKTVLTTLVFAAWLSPGVCMADIVVSSWNLKHLGWGDQKRFDQVAHVAQHFDLLALQELMTDDALTTLEQAVEAATGESWSSMASHALGRSTYRERYGFLWRDSAVSYDSGAVVYLDNRNVFAREPYSARFTSRRTGQSIALANVHITYGDSVSDRLPEIEALANYWEWLAEVYPETPRLLAGDFNLQPNHEGWQLLRQQGAQPTITEGKSTLGLSEGTWSNLYDNIWMSPEALTVSERGILHFPALFPESHLETRVTISDHAPVWLALGNTSLELTAYNGSPYTASSASGCIDLNTARAKELHALPHVGKARAEQIVQLRPWQAAADLTKVHGLGKVTVAEIVSSGLACQ